jgi:predicted thioesterase
MWVAWDVVMVETGMRGDAKLVVTDTDTARSLGSGDVDVLGTPRLISLCEEATVAALSGALDEGTTTVGMRIQVDHLQPTPVGAEVVAEAIVDKVDGRRITFTVSASDTGGLIAAGKITRVVVDRTKFMGKCCAP